MRSNHGEYDPSKPQLIISRLDCSLRGREMTLSFLPGSRVAHCHGVAEARERYYCNFGINPEYAAALKSGGFRVVGSDQEGGIRVMELENHPFFIGTLYVPQARPSAAAPHPLVTGFLAAASAGIKSPAQKDVFSS
jgi:CTP synthase (UTP-ammonia lyase)